MPAADATSKFLVSRAPELVKFCDKYIKESFCTWISAPLAFPKLSPLCLNFLDLILPVFRKPFWAVVVSSKSVFIVPLLFMAPLELIEIFPKVFGSVRIVPLLFTLLAFIYIYLFFLEIR